MRPQSKLAIPGNADVILRTGFESGAKTLVFNPDEDVITALVQCRGGGKFVLDTGKPNGATPWPCDGVPIHATVLSNGDGRRVFEINAPKAAVWEMAVIEGDGPDTKVTT
ncbi:MAG: hypothetical protein ABI586_03760 [Candidatus Nanopelagicales bacterium]